MQENDFENTVRKKMEALQLVPNDDVWHKVSTTIHKDKRRKRFIILFVFVFLIASGGLYFYLNSFKTSSSLTAGNIKLSENLSPRKDSILIEEKTVTDGKYLSNNQKSKHLNKQPEEEENGSHAKLIYKTNTRYRTPLKPSFLNELNATVTTDSTIKEKEIKNEVAHQNFKNKFNKTQDSLIAENNLSQESDSNKIDTIQSRLSDKIAEESADNNNAIISKSETSKVKNPVNKKWNIGFTGFGGLSNNISGVHLFSLVSSNYLSSLPSQSTGGVGTGNGNAAISRLNYNGNFSYGFGVYIKRQLSTKTAFSAGINYHLGSAISYVGARSNTTQTFYDLNLQNSATVNGFYRSGQMVKYNNKYYLIQLPLNILIRLNKNERKAVLLTGGLSGTYLASSKALYANYNRNVYYTDNTQFKKLFLTAQAGMQFTLFNKAHFNLSGGPELQYGINNMARSATLTDQHLFTAELRFNITLQ